MRKSASVTYRLLAVTPWKGVAPPATSATSAPAGAAANRYSAKLPAKAELLAAIRCCRGC
jgi:hypothetical protein